jgi:hypothetical protein
MVAPNEPTRLLRAVWSHDGRSTLTLVLGEQGTWPVLPELTGAEIDDRLRQAVADTLVEGVRQGGDGSVMYWSGLRLRLPALWELGEWPPYHGEYLPGPWDDGYWGTAGKPKLAELAASRDSFCFKPIGSSDQGAWAEWEVVSRLYESDLIDGHPVDDGLADVRITKHGMQVLEPPEDEPLVRARTDLARDARADAINAAIEQALRPHLERLADALGLATHTERGRRKHLAVLNDELASSGVYGEDVRAEVAAWNALRNRVMHGDDAGVSTRRLEWLIEGVGWFIDENPIGR